MIESLYSRFLDLTKDPGAAATLVLAEILSSKEPEWLDVKQAAAKLGIGKTKMYELLATGSLPHKRVGRQIRIALKELSNTVSDPAPKDVPEKQLTYILREAGTGYLKIGKSKCAASRKRQLQIGNAEELKIETICVTAEEVLHEVFAPWRVRRGGTEWFQESPLLRDLIAYYETHVDLPLPCRVWLEPDLLRQTLRHELDRYQALPQKHKARKLNPYIPVRNAEELRKAFDKMSPAPVEENASPSQDS